MPDLPLGSAYVKVMLDYSSLLAELSAMPARIAPKMPTLMIKVMPDMTGFATAVQAGIGGIGGAGGGGAITQAQLLSLAGGGVGSNAFGGIAGGGAVGGGGGFPFGGFNMTPGGAFVRGAVTAFNPWLGMMMGAGRGQMGITAGLGAGYAGVTFGQQAIGGAMERGWEEAIIRRVTGATGAGGTGMIEGIRGIGERIPVDQMQVYKLAQGLGRAGMGGAGGQGLAGATEGMAKLALVIDDMNPEELAIGMSRLLDIFDKTPNSIEGIGGALVALDQTTTATASQILQMTQRLAGATGAMGMNLQQTMAISTLAAQVGIRPERGASSFARIMTKMATEPERFARQLNLDPGVFADLVQRNPMEAFQMTVGALSKLPKGSEQTQAIYSEMEIHEVRTIEMLQKFAAEFEKLPGLLDSATEAVKPLNDMLNQMKETPQGKMIETRNRMQRRFSDVGDLLLGVADWAATGIEQLGTEGVIREHIKTARQMDDPTKGKPRFITPMMWGILDTPIDAPPVSQARAFATELAIGAFFGNREGGDTTLDEEDRNNRWRIENRINKRSTRLLGFDALSGFNPIEMMTGGAFGLMREALEGSAGAKGRGTPFFEGRIMDLASFTKMSSEQVLNSAKNIDDWQKRVEEEQLKTQQDMLVVLNKLEKSAGFSITGAEK